MRNPRALSIIFTSVMAAAPALANDIFPLGCFARDYSTEHLSAHPSQVVERLRLNFYQLEGSAPDSLLYFNVIALMADQGHAAQDGLGGNVMTETGFCNRPSGCGVEADGGTFEITQFDGDMIEFTTSHLRVGMNRADDYDGVYSSLGETYDAETTYRLYAAQPEACSEF
ncbi:hypothetical protein [Nioella aestuarii]|uniref:hypothetical protein n=1 Tax=Nioella aestuarii TaxID=1662864 RepID=UPI003D7F4EF2